MRKSLSVLIMMLVSAVLMLSCAGNDSKTKNETEDMSVSLTDRNVLVVYFSRTGENYAVGNITEGNTRIIAGMIGEATGGTLFEIVPETAYPDGYDECVDIAKREKAAKARPAVKGDIAVEDYDVVFVGYPNWWGDMPMPVYTFLEKHSWAGKTVIPFCTHEGSGLSDTERLLAGVCKGAKVADGLAVEGSVAQNSREQARRAVLAWLAGL